MVRVFATSQRTIPSMLNDPYFNPDVQPRSTGREHRLPRLARPGFRGRIRARERSTLHRLRRDLLLGVPVVLAVLCTLC